ncbi:unnamed protein product [Camellia sinensis]
MRCSDNFDLGLDVSPKEDYELRSTIIDDDKDKFVSGINHHKYKADVIPLVHWEWIFEYGALKCATALLQGETSQTVDFYSSDTFRLPMTHTLARTYNYDLIKLFICHGASFDHRSYGVGQSLWYLEGKLPLNTAVESILQMDSIRVLVLNTKEAELEICHYAKEGNVVELAVLLMTAREEVALLKLSKEQVALDIAWLLQGAKILPKYRGINLNKIWYAIRAKELVKRKLKDGEMNRNAKVGIEGPEESVTEEPKAAICFSSSKMEAIYSKICKSNRVPKNDRDKASNKEINIFPTASCSQSTTSSRDVQQCASVAIAIKMGISICTTALPLWDEVVGSTTAAEVGDGDEVMQAVTTNAAIG